MSCEKTHPVAVTDTECDPCYVVIRYRTRQDAEWYLGYLREHGGTATRKKVDRGGYEIREDAK